MKSDAEHPFAKGSDSEGAFALLAEMTQAFAGSLDIEMILERGLGRIAENLHSEAGSLWLVSDDGSQLECKASVGPDPITGLKISIDQGIIGRSIRENSCQTVLDVSQDPHFDVSVDEESGFATRSLLCAPMFIDEHPLGAIELVNKLTDANRCFNEGDIHPLQVLTSSAALAISNARKAVSLLEAQRVQRELELAAEIQRNLLPASRPPPFPIHGMNIPARTVSGDFFDILPLPDGRIAFCLGDVSGKGMNAAMLMAKTASLYRCLTKTIGSPGEVLQTVNDEICETATRGMFVTMAAGIFDATTGLATVANAGHEPLLRHAADGSFDSFEAGGPPLGIVGGSPFPEFQVDLRGGALYTFSDGLTEACDETGEQLGSDGFKALIVKLADQPVIQHVESIIAQVSLLELRDDLTLLAVVDPGEPAS